MIHRSASIAPGRVPRTLLLVCVIVVVVVALPVGVTVIQAFQGGYSAAAGALRSSASLVLLRNSLLVALLATPSCGVLGVASAWFIERTRLPGRWLWSLLMVAPLTVPPFVTSYAWATLGAHLQGFFGAAGIIAFSYYPIVFLLIIVALRGMDPALEETARSLGLSARQTFFRVVLPQLRPALLGGMLLVALDALVEFDAFVALKFQTFSLDIYAQYQLGFSASGAAALALFSIVICLVLLFGEARLRGHANYTRVSQGARRASVRYELGRAKLPVLAGFAVVAAISVGIPVGMLIDWFFPRAARPPLFDGSSQHAVPPAGNRDLHRARRRGSARCLPPRPPGRDPRGSVSGPGRDGPRARHLPLLRAPRHRRGDRALVRRKPVRTLPVRQFCPARRGGGDAVRALCRGGDESDARADRARSRGLCPLAGRGPAPITLARHAPARPPRVRGGGCACLCIRARRPVHRAGPPPFEYLHPRYRVRSEQLDGRVRRSGTVRRCADRTRDGCGLHPHEPLRQGPGTRKRLMTGELNCHNLAKSYGDRRVLSDVDLVVSEGTLTAILGASGSGKTTLLRLVIGFIAADGGTISIGGTVVAEAGRIHVPADKRAVGYVAQEGALFPHLTVAQNVAFGLPRSARKTSARIGEMLDLVALGREHAPRRPHELSGGEQRRVALARALAPRPRLVLLDEPFSALDAALRAETRDAVLNALAKEGTTAVLVTHDQAEALSMGNEVGVLRCGRLVQTGRPTTLYRAPVDLDIARFVGEAVVLPGLARSRFVECVLGNLPVHNSSLEGRVQVMVRPEQLRLVPAELPASTQPRPIVTATVMGRSYYGPDTVIRLVLEDSSRAPLLVRTFDHAAPDNAGSSSV